MNRIVAMHALIQQQRILGLNPQEIHANQATVESFTVEAGLKPVQDTDTRSLLARMRAPEGRPAPRYLFDGLTVVANPSVPGNALILRPAQLMQDPMWPQKHVVFGEKPELQEIPPDGTPWHAKVENVPEAPLGKEESTLDLLNAAGGITPTDVLMKAMDGLDSVQDVVILRFKRSGDVELCGTMDRMRMMGALQLAMSYVMRDGQ